ncbi:MAG: type II and III secretion system protein family protein [Asticcacaulis sp.]|uniref:type II and III secretion system protein family protein n=1 Tax=Asticcacaulis sp. TaxID=1872648 RepID=UPI0039E37752
MSRPPHSSLKNPLLGGLVPGGLGLLAAASLFWAAPSWAGPAGYSVGASGGLQVQTQAPVKTQVLNLPKGRSAVIDLPVDASDVFVSNPAVADAVLRTPRRIFVLGVASGQSDAIFFDGMGRQILNLSIRVDTSTDGLADAVERLFPGTHVEVQSLNGHIILSGMAHDAGESDQISRLAASYADKPENVLNLMTIAGKDQVSLKVRIVEVNRSSLKQLGLSTSITYNNGTNSLSFGRDNSFSVNGGYQGSQGLCYSQTSNPSTDACLEAFEQVGLARTLAEPNLTAVSGESAKFLAGGEYPVPTGEDDQGRVTIEFKPYGVGLGFTPVVLSGGRIALKISTEVSELTNTGAYTVSGGVTVSALSVRRAETSVEMQSGSSLMIAGLLQSKVKESIGSMPGLTSLPIIGSLFRSRDFLNDETEMVVLVTPYIVDPTHPGALQTPADGLQAASDLNATFMGTLNKIVKPAASTASGDAPPPPPQAYGAPVGYVIE